MNTNGKGRRDYLTYLDVDKGVPYLLGHRDLLRPDWSLHESNTVGFARGVCRGIIGTNFANGLVFMPIGQRSPKHSYSGEHLIFLLEGEVEFATDDSTYSLEPFDTLFIPAEIVYEYANIGRGMAVFVNMLGRVSDWPPASNYKV